MIKKYTKTILPFLACALLTTGCSKEQTNFDNPQTGSGEMGYLVLSGMNVSVATDAEVLSSIDSKASTAQTTEASDDYKVKIKSVKTGSVQEFTYADLKKAENQKIALQPGDYIVSAESGDYAEYMSGEHYADWEKPVYRDSVVVVITKNEEKTVDNLTCKLANIKTTVSLSTDLQGLFKTDEEAATDEEKLKVALSIGDNGLTYGRTEANSGKAGHFKAVSESNTLKLNLTGHYNKAAGDEAPQYVPVTWSKEITNCKAGQWRRISINVENADQGNAQFQITVETWAYDSKIDVDVMKWQPFIEETIPDEDVSDAGSPVVTLDGKDITQGYSLTSSMFDAELGKWKENLKAVITPNADGATVESIDMVFESDNPDFITALENGGYANHKVALWPVNGEISTYVLVKESSSTSAITATVTDEGMSALFQYKGTHTVKFVSKDSKGRTSYTPLTIRSSDDAPVAGPNIVWTDKSGSKTYDFGTRYNHNEVEIVIGVTSQTGVTGFEIDIISDNVLTPGELIGVGLNSHLDLANPGEYQTALEGLGFPTGANVQGQQSLSFDISSFMELLTMLNQEGNCDFKLTVTDASGTNVKTIQLYVTPKSE